MDASSPAPASCRLAARSALCSPARRGTSRAGFAARPWRGCGRRPAPPYRLYDRGHRARRQDGNGRRRRDPRRSRRFWRGISGASRGKRSMSGWSSTSPARAPPGSRAMPAKSAGCSRAIGRCSRISSAASSTLRSPMAASAPAEDDYLREVARHFGFDAADFARIRALHVGAPPGAAQRPLRDPRRPCRRPRRRDPRGLPSSGARKSSRPRHRARAAAGMHRAGDRPPRPDQCRLRADHQGGGAPDDPASDLRPRLAKP